MNDKERKQLMIEAKTKIQYCIELLDQKQEDLNEQLKQQQEGGSDGY